MTATLCAVSAILVSIFVLMMVMIELLLLPGMIVETIEEWNVLLFFEFVCFMLKQQHHHQFFRGDGVIVAYRYSSAAVQVRYGTVHFIFISRTNY